MPFLLIAALGVPLTLLAGKGLVQETGDQVARTTPQIGTLLLAAGALYILYETTKRGRR